jgi:hypothetical protein
VHKVTEAFIRVIISCKSVSSNAWGGDARVQLRLGNNLKKKTLSKQSKTTKQKKTTSFTRFSFLFLLFPCLFHFILVIESGLVEHKL